jgi:hypothetical protein
MNNLKAPQVGCIIIMLNPKKPADFDKKEIRPSTLLMISRAMRPRRNNL